ncbi:3-hydroxy-3-methylglutaryl-coenzyme A reductase-like isoform X1 [Stylophora pistillata]|uniref:3-hydroxy-3-methylglutaryl coenzyme A reductase n=2 Tax=Stylophora pistillata TaxID=50429 RepID=A0A2B4T2Z4_STYPI|nr:3-hydroxy-3-methylglutaryl-coenzyme A reductase-like isoform X1 [Stylophora pistillata]PFX34975.1 3-hydroxy-3-methylglutaryl-coenzyme A reductase [Stylophora pistillata]
MSQSGISNLFYYHGRQCSRHPVEVLLVCITGTVCLLSLNIYDATHSSKDLTIGSGEEISLPAGLHVGPTSYFFALVCIYLQCKKLIHQGSSYILGFVSMFAVFSCLVFSSIVANLYGRDFWVVREALPYFFLLSDFNTASSLVKHTLQSSTYSAVPGRIAESICYLGPTVTLNTLVGTLVIGIGTLSDVTELETICQFGCLSLITHYVLFMTFFPACLSLFLELCTGRGNSRPRWQLESSDTTEEELEPNPVVQQIKLIMSTGLMFVHLHRWVMVRSGDNSENSFGNTPLEEDWFKRFLAGNTEQIVVLVFGVSLAIRFFLYNEDRMHEHVEQTHIEARASNTTVTDIQGGEQESDKSSEESLASEKTAETRSEPVCLSRKEAIKEENQEQSQKLSSITKLKVHDRRRTVSEGHCSVCYSSDDIKHPLALARLDSSPPIAEYKERSMEECKLMLKQPDGVLRLNDKEVQMLVECKTIPGHQLEKVLKDPARAVRIRRSVVSKKLSSDTDLFDLPCDHYNYSDVVGACCENVIGYMPVPVGVAGPLLLDGENYHVPMATTEGCLVASTNRGCRALLLSGGVRSSVFSDGMTRGPVVRFPSAVLASNAKQWLEEEKNFMEIKKEFDSTSRFARLQSVRGIIAGRLLFIRFVASTGDAMGMNMVSKGTEKALTCLQGHFPTLEVLSLSGNVCTDKKATAINWIEGRGKSVVCEAIIPGHVVQKVLKTTVSALSELNINKNLVGSAMAGAIGGFNAHAANIVTAIFIATGQDPAQCVSSSNCITLFEACGPTKEDLYVSCTMPSLEVGTVGGGTVLGPQSACLKILGVRGPNKSEPGKNSTKLAQIICGTVLAGELSLLSALATGDLVRSHLTLNRSTVNLFVDGVDGSKNCAVL